MAYTPSRPLRLHACQNILAAALSQQTRQQRTHAPMIPAANPYIMPAFI
ncbi:MAG: hypothetical protein ACJAUN_001493 [Alcanivorax sp.]|jgi:hypothetical protein